MAEPRVLLIAEAANPEWVSVPLVGWSHGRELTRQVSAHVVTHVRNRDAILRAGWTEGDEFTAIDSEAVAAPVYKLASVLRGGEAKGWTTLAALSTLSYYYFEHLVWKQFGARIESGEFNIVHRLTPLSPSTPSIIANRCRRAGAHFVWGPINGGAPWPKGHEEARRSEGEWLAPLRGLHKLLPGYGATRRNASAIIVGSRITWNQVPEKHRHKCVYIPENAVDPERFTHQVEGPVRKPLRVAFVGRLVPCKGVDLLIMAAAPLVRDGKARLDILGDGPEMDRLRQLVREERIEDGVALDGWVDHEKLQERLTQSDVLGFPSVRDFGGGVVLEAMMLGLVPVVLDYAGPSELVTEQTGFKIPMGNRDEIVTRLRETLTRLAENVVDLRAMGRRARDRILRRFTWSAKARQTAEVYRWVIGARDDKPDFGMPFGDEQL